MNDFPKDADPAETEHPNLGLAGVTAKAFITSPLSLLLLLAFFAVGVLGMWVTPRQEDPQISVPMVDIFVRYPRRVGAGSRKPDFPPNGKYPLGNDQGGSCLLGFHA